MSFLTINQDGVVAILLLLDLFPIAESYRISHGPLARNVLHACGDSRRKVLTDRLNRIGNELTSTALKLLSHEGVSPRHQPCLEYPITARFFAFHLAVERVVEGGVNPFLGCLFVDQPRVSHELYELVVPGVILLRYLNEFGVVGLHLCRHIVPLTLEFTVWNVEQLPLRVGVTCPALNHVQLPQPRLVLVLVDGFKDVEQAARHLPILHGHILDHVATVLIGDLSPLPCAGNVTAG